MISLSTLPFLLKRWCSLLLPSPQQAKQAKGFATTKKFATRQKRCKSYGAQQNCNRDKRRRRSEQQRNEGLSGGFSKACYFIFYFLNSKLFFHFWFSLAANFKTENNKEFSGFISKPCLLLI
jgi:hypothetical protein